MNSLSLLNWQQKKAVSTTQCPVLILAGAGSRKTRIIIQRITHLIQKKQVSPKQILAVIFTNKVVEEMRERLQEILSGKQKGIQLSNFHALDVSLLRDSIHQRGYLPNFIIYENNQLVFYEIF